MGRAPASGERSRRFTLEMPLESPDGFGGVIRTYQPGPRVWGAMEMIALAERTRAGGPQAAVSHRVRLPFRSDVTDRMQLTLGLRRFRIKAVSDPDGARRQLVCLIEEMRP
ncbi:MAG: head-tail adaptor protein [Enterovirga sp.]|jgi:SPP1 family predicted phage head-tail adaptor|nr:head-tail adaptor protein [Enterovirga sp.]